METSNRKLDHILICLGRDVRSRIPTGFEDIYLVHKAFPEVSLEKIDCSIEFLGYQLNYPFMITGITGGHGVARRINENLARIAEDLGIAIGVGSQRAAMEDSKLVDTYRIVRDVAQSVPVVGNIGIAQVSEYSIPDLEKLVSMIDADALAVHLNPLQEAIQPEGDVDATGWLDSLSKLVESIDIPVIVKETGCGISMEVAEVLNTIGIYAIDVSGAGGTSWALVESYRAEERGDAMRAEIGRTFAGWGIPTAISVIEVSSVGGEFKVIASGGIRSGLDMAKAIALGADLCGMAQPLLEYAYRGDVDGAKRFLGKCFEELRLAMFLTGCSTIGELKEADVVITGFVREWLEWRGVAFRGARK